MSLRRLLLSRRLSWSALVLAWLLLGGTLGFSRFAWAGDPGGNKTGVAADAQDASGSAFVVSEPAKDDPEYATKMKAYEEFKAQADKEPLALKLVDFVGQNRVAINIVWTLVTGFLVMFMQAGFALVETGFCRAKNASHTMLMNFLIYVIGLTGFWIAGFALMYGATPVGSLGGTSGLDPAKEAVITLFGKPFGLFAKNGWFLSDPVYDVGVFTIFLFQMVFMDTAATIPTGAMAERWRLQAFFIYGFFISMLLYPLYGNWAWGGGWMSQLGVNLGLGHGYVDFAGSGVVHAVGGLCGLAGAMVLGPRIGKYNKDGTVNPIPAHHIPMALLGTFILAFGWFGFNPGSTLGVSGGGLNRVGIIATVTMLASAGGTLSAAAYMVLTTGKPDSTMCANGMLAGLVAITAPSGFVGANAGFIIGIIAGVLVCLSVKFLDKVQVDDPVGAISVHGTCGLWGVLSVGIFADGTAFYGGSWNGVPGSVTGCLYGDWGQFAAQAIGCLTLLTWAFGFSWVFFKVLDFALGMRVAPEVELEGLDLAETGVLGYPDFVLVTAGRPVIPATVEVPREVVRPVPAPASVSMRQPSSEVARPAPAPASVSMRQPPTPVRQTESRRTSPPVRLGETRTPPPVRPVETRAASATAGEPSFEISVPDVDKKVLRQIWNDLCQKYPHDVPQEFSDIYLDVRSFRDNIWTFRKGNPEEYRRKLEKILYLYGVEGVRLEVAEVA